MENLINTVVLAAVVAAAFPIAFVAARLCLNFLVRALPERPSAASRNVRD